MEDRIEAAAGCFREGFNCSQAIISTYGGAFGLDRVMALRTASALGAGMGCLGEVCGAVTGALMVIGLKHGQTEAKDKAAKAKTYACARAFGERFREEHGSLLCRELLGCDLGTEEGMATARQKGYFIELCPKFVRSAARLLEEAL